MDHYGYGLSQWEESLLCNTFSHWPSPNSPCVICGYDFKSTNFKLIVQKSSLGIRNEMLACVCHRSLLMKKVNIGLYNGLVPSGNKRTPGQANADPCLCVAIIWHHYATICDWMSSAGYNIVGQQWVRAEPSKKMPHDCPAKLTNLNKSNTIYHIKNSHIIISLAKKKTTMILVRCNPFPVAFMVSYGLASPLAFKIPVGRSLWPWGKHKAFLKSNPRRDDLNTERYLTKWLICCRGHFEINSLD